MDPSQNHNPSVAESMQARPHHANELTLFDRLNEKTLEVVRERPILCLMGALTFGFVVGKIAARY